MIIRCDTETFSSVDLKTHGMYKYMESPDFEVLLLAYSIDGAPVTVIDLAQGESVPTWLQEAFYDPANTISGWNVIFERTALSKLFGREIPLTMCRDTMLSALYCGYPASLEGAGDAIGLPQDKRKLTTGKALIKLFCTPTKPTRTNGQRVRTLPRNEPEKWNLFKEYNAQDVVTEMEIANALSAFPVSDEVQEQWVLDQIINQRGVGVDMKLVEGALKIGAETHDRLLAEAAEISGLDNPKSVQQLTKWLEKEIPDEMEGVNDLRKETVTDLLAAGVKSADAERMLEIRQLLGKTSTKKYDSIARYAGADGRARGLFQFYGANRTGRWAGRGPQIQNLPRNYLETLDSARQLVLNGDTESVEMLYGNVPDTLSQLIRTAFIPSAGRQFIVTDFSAIEARVLAWLAGEQWVLDVFATTGKIYEATASQMFGVPVEKIVHGNPEYELRQRGKVATLACIAEGELVTTDVGLVPIEKVTTDMRVWDGKEWVKHGGVIYKGRKTVVFHDNLWATPDHLCRPMRSGLPEYVPLGALKRDNEKLYVCATCPGRTVLITRRVAKTYDIVNAGARHCFTVSGRIVHNCGYQGSAGAMARMDIQHKIDPAQYPELVAKWRAANPRIVQYWYDVERAALRALKTGLPSTVGCVTYRHENDGQRDFLTCELPSGRKLFYVAPFLTENRFGKEAIGYWGQDQTTKKWSQMETYGGHSTENCISGEALVLTQRGVIPLRSLLLEDLLWDGLTFCKHGGKISKGIKQTVLVDGVGFTPDHKILCEKGWVRADETEGHYRRKVMVPNSFTRCWFQRAKTHMGDTMRSVWKNIHDARKRVHKEETKILWVPHGGAHPRSQYNTRSLKDASIRRLAFDERALSYADCASVEELRGERNHGLRGVAAQLRALSRRHGWFVSKRVTVGSAGQRAGVLQGKLPLGNGERKRKQYPRVPKNSDPLGGSNGKRSFASQRYWAYHTSIPPELRLPFGTPVRQAGLIEEVFDVLNVGRKNRFCVLGEHGWMLVHNCSQAVARDCLMVAIQRLEAAGFPVVMHIHDEVVLDCPMDKTLDDANAIMGQPIPWAPGLLLKGAGFVGNYYKKD